MKNLTLCLYAFIIAMVMPLFTVAQNSKASNGFSKNLIFVDSEKFVSEFLKDSLTSKLYHELEKKKDYVSYKYDFKILQDGTIVPGFYGGNSQINFFIKNRFNKYKWEIRKKGNKTIVAYGSLNIDIVPVYKKAIELAIFVNDESFKLEKKYPQKIMSKTIKM